MPKMKDLVRYRAMESLCRQSAVFHPLESWRLLAEAEMWHHKALDEMALDEMASDPLARTSRRAIFGRTEPLSKNGDSNPLPAALTCARAGRCNVWTKHLCHPTSPILLPLLAPPFLDLR